jgi:hypothetical protein
MNIVYKTPEAEGKHIAYDISGNKITFGDDEKMLNLAKYERDDAVYIVDSVNASGILVGNSEGLYYAYEIDVPARAYTYVDDGKDDDGKLKQAKVAVPFDMDNCTLTLWELEV